MTQLFHTVLNARHIVRIGGEDARTFLQGMITNDITKVTVDHARYAGLLSPKGRFLHDFFITEIDGAFYFDCEGARVDDLLKRLRMYRLRAKVDIDDVSDAWCALAIFGDATLNVDGLGDLAGDALPWFSGTLCVDPRLKQAGWRAVLPKGSVDEAVQSLDAEAVDEDAYDVMRINLGLPDGSRDMTVDRAIPLENGFDELNGVDFDKGCFIGQELTANTKHRLIIRKRLMPVAIEGDVPEPGTTLLAGGRKAGEMCSSAGTNGLAMIRIEHLEAGLKDGFSAGDAHLFPRVPDWMVVPAQEEA